MLQGFRGTVLMLDNRWIGGVAWLFCLSSPWESSALEISWSCYSSSSIEIGHQILLCIVKFTSGGVWGLRRHDLFRSLAFGSAWAIDLGCTRGIDRDLWPLGESLGGDGDLFVPSPTTPLLKPLSLLHCPFWFLGHRCSAHPVFMVLAVLGLGLMGALIGAMPRRSGRGAAAVWSSRTVCPCSPRWFPLLQLLGGAPLPHYLLFLS